MQSGSAEASDDAGSNSGDASSGEVEVDVYSGRENPTVPISSDELDELTSVVNELATLPQPPSSAADGLGFRAFVVSPFEYEGQMYSARFTRSDVTLVGDEGVDDIYLSDESGKGFELLLAIVERQDPALADLTVEGS